MNIVYNYYYSFCSGILVSTLRCCVFAGLALIELPLLTSSTHRLSSFKEAFGDLFLLEVDLAEEGRGKEQLHDHAPNERACTDGNADQMLILTEGDSANWGTSVLHEEVLHDHGAHKDQKEEGIVEEAAEDVELLNSELASVDLVENLHAYKGLEDDRVVGQFAIVRLAKVGVKFASWAIDVSASRVAGGAVVEALEVIVVIEAE
jgi:hypothetical protein